MASTYKRNSENFALVTYFQFLSYWAVKRSFTNRKDNKEC